MYWEAQAIFSIMFKNVENKLLVPFLRYLLVFLRLERSINHLQSDVTSLFVEFVKFSELKRFGNITFYHSYFVGSFLPMFF